MRKINGGIKILRNVLTLGVKVAYSKVGVQEERCRKKLFTCGNAVARVIGYELMQAGGVQANNCGVAELPALNRTKPLTT